MPTSSLKYESGGHKRLRVLVLGGCWPRLTNEQEAADVVTYETLFNLSNSDDLEIFYARVGKETLAEDKPALEHRRYLESNGVVFLPEILVAINPLITKFDRLFRGCFLGDPRYTVVGAGQEARVAEAISDMDCTPDAILVVWSELAVAAASGLQIPIVSYHGDPEPEVFKAILEFEYRSTVVSDLRSHFILLQKRLILFGFRRAHLKIMRRLAAVLDVSDNVARNYRAKGVSVSSYIPNMWRSSIQKDWQTKRDKLEELDPLKILGSIGNVHATGNSFGLETLASKVLPALEIHPSRPDFECHIFGGGTPYSCIASFLKNPRIRLRGFVDDLDGEILSCPIFLVPNNFGWFKVGHTRFLHAWSLGACVIAFRDSVKTMPELAHNKNILLATSPEDMANLIVLAAQDRDLRRRIGHGGIETLKTRFDPASVVSIMAETLRRAASFNTRA